MVLKCVFCSDLDLEYKFRHMPSKDVLIYEEDQLENFDNFIKKCLELKVDIVFIAGNLFGTSKPKNKTIEKVITSFKNLSDNGIKVFISPGSHDTPLSFSNDTPVHNIFKNIKNVNFLYSDDPASREIKYPVFKGQINNNSLQIFSLPTPFIKPDEFEFNLEIEEGFTSIIIISDIYSFKKETKKIFNNFLDMINDSGIDFLLVGGIIPDSIKKNNYKFQIINCPQIHQNNFNFCDCADGISICTFDDGKFTQLSDIIPISKFKVIHKIMELPQIIANEVNNQIYEIIKDYSNPKKHIFRLSLTGKMDKKQYHQIKIFKFSEMGRRLNYYFELLDKIEFEENSPDIQGLNVLNELKIFTDLKIDEIQKLSLGDSIKSDSIMYLKEALNQIEKDWGS